jgi:hypothetical protein
MTANAVAVTAATRQKRQIGALTQSLPAADML